MNKKVLSHNIMLRGKYVLLTGDYRKAIILEYLIMRQNEDGEWFNVSYKMISSETYLDLSIPPIKNYINELMLDKLIVIRNDRLSGFASSNQYKVCFDKIDKDIKKYQDYISNEEN